MGLDIGGSGIKGAIVDTETGTFVGERLRLATPSPATPEAIVATVGQITTHFGWKGRVGCGFPAVIKGGVVYSAANIDPSWVGKPGQQMLEEQTGCAVLLINDADAAGTAEMVYGAGKGRSGVVMVITLGTGIGTALFINGHLVPNTELGHLEIDGKEAEKWASDGVRKGEDLGWTKWTKRLDTYLGVIERLFSPNLIILGGGVSRKHAKYLPLLTIQTEVVPAALLNEAGIVGAALAAERALGEPPTIPHA
jgi:polyphosphate glucokinase